MDVLVTLTLLAVLLAAPCFVQLVLWTAYTGLNLVLSIADAAGERSSTSRRATVR